MTIFILYMRPTLYGAPGSLHGEFTRARPIHRSIDYEDLYLYYTCDPHSTPPVPARPAVAVARRRGASARQARVTVSSSIHIYIYIHIHLGLICALRTISSCHAAPRVNPADPAPGPRATQSLHRAHPRSCARIRPRTATAS